MIYQTNQPWTVQVELVEGCNRLCAFCGINAIRTRPGDYKYMTVETATKVAIELGAIAPKCKIHFAMHGEPLQHPQFHSMVSLFRTILPEVEMMVVTNGRVIMNDLQGGLNRIFEAGIDMVMLDTYEPERGRLRAGVEILRGILVSDYYGDVVKGNAPNPYMNHHRKVRGYLCVMDDIGIRNGEHPSRKLHNHSGSNPLGTKVQSPLQKTCTKPFREMSVNWNGDVRLCCEDWTGAYTCGNLNERSAADIWYGPEFESARTMLQNKRRDFGACKVCDASSGMRCGLLPKYPSVSPEVESIVRNTEKEAK